MYYFILSLTGGLIAIMVSINGTLSLSAGMTSSLIFIHITGLTASSLFCLHEKPPGNNGRKPSPVLFLPGLLGVVLTSFNIYCANTLGISLTLALGLLGQLSGSFIVDMTGMPGIQKRPLNLLRVLSLVIASIGCFMMIDNPSALLSPAVILAVVSGLLVTATSTMNASLASFLGTFHGVRMNFITGLAGSLLFFLLKGTSLSGLTAGFLGTPWYIITGGGLCGVLVVSCMNFSLPHVSILYSTMVLYAGQLVFGYVIDFLQGHPADLQGLSAGAVIMLGLSLKPLGKLPLFQRLRRPV